ncbi:MAG: DUF2520 domain-containing protein [Ruminococcus flavefaciens]|nr:DUF2520 domain-containing protein [Ruminococcus flavefaciens]MCM1061359.1 DUF2520 domain-containing protein [Eubacterium sp.]
MNIGFIGAGKVGFSLGKYFSENGINVTGYYSQKSESAKDAAEFTSSEQYNNTAKLISDSSIIFLTVPDSEIKKIYDKIKRLGISGKQICHCSGSITASEAFPDISEYGAFGYSIHPLFPISDKYNSYTKLNDAFFCIEGDTEYLDEWINFFNKIGNRIRIISGETKREYHAACAVSSNLVCALVYESISLMKKCGFTEEDALSALKPLVMNNIRNIFEAGPVAALTGPVERCDTSTVIRHLECINDEQDRTMYKSLSLKLIELAQKKHPDTNYEYMRQILSSDFSE